jgi:hypothetical protein
MSSSAAQSREHPLSVTYFSFNIVSSIQHVSQYTQSVIMRTVARAASRNDFEANYLVRLSGAL